MTSPQAILGGATTTAVASYARSSRVVHGIGSKRIIGSSARLSRARGVRCAASASSDAGEVSPAGGVERRRVLFGAASLAAAAGANTTMFALEASAVELTKEYKDEEDKYAFKVPGDWEMAEGTTSPNPQSTRRVVAFYPPGSPEVNGEKTNTVLVAVLALHISPKTPVGELTTFLSRHNCNRPK